MSCAPARVITPLPLTLDSSTATSDYAEWAAGTSYAEGDRVLLSTDSPPAEYEAVQATTGHPPATSAAYWLRLGPSNPYRMLDGRSANATAKAGGFAATVVCPSRATHVALLGINNATSLTVSVEDGAGNAVGWSEPISGVSSDDGVPIPLSDRTTTTWSEYFFGAFEGRSLAIITLAGWPSAAEVTFTLSGSGVVSLAHCVAGVSTPLGATLYGVQSALESFSTRELDDFGTPLLVPRISSQRLEATLIVDDAALDKLRRLRRDLDATPAVWQLSDGQREALTVFAFFEDFSVELKGYNETYCSLDLIEMT